MDVSSEQFDEPRLKAAVQRAWAGQCAPESLVQRVESLLASEPGRLHGAEVGDALFAKPQQASRNGRRDANVSHEPLHLPLSMAGLAVAAMLIVAIGGISLFLGSNSNPTSLPSKVALAMVTTHDGCCRALDHHHLPGVPPDDLKAIAAKLGGELGIPVLAADPGEGWKFAGAGKCPVGSFFSAHLLFRRGNETLSVFTMPASDFQLAQSPGQYEAIMRGHALAGFVRAGGLYCLVVEHPGGSVAQEDAETMRDRLEGEFTTAAILPSPAPATPALALYVP